jgi:hypothetical protein
MIIIKIILIRFKKYKNNYFILIQIVIKILIILIKKVKLAPINILIL